MSKANQWRLAAQRTLFWVGAFFAVTYLAYMLGSDPTALRGATDTAYAAINPYRVWLLGLRWCGFLAVWWVWPALVVNLIPDVLPKYEERRAVLLGLRHRVFIGLLCLELVLQLARA